MLPSTAYEMAVVVVVITMIIIIVDFTLKSQEKRESGGQISFPLKLFGTEPKWRCALCSILTFCQSYILHWASLRLTGHITL